MTGLPERLQVTLFRDMPAEGRTSMEVYASELASALRAHRWGQLTVDECSYDEVRLVRRGLPFPLAAKIDNYLSRFVGYPLSARRQRAHVYHIVDHGYGHLAYALDRSRTVVTCHDLMLLRAADGSVPQLPRPRIATAAFRVSLSALPRVAQVVADSETTKLDVTSYLGVPPERVVVIPPGVSPQFRSLPPAESAAACETLSPRLLGQGPFVLHVGSVSPYKNIEGLLRVFARVARTLESDAVLVRAGSKLEEKHLLLADSLGVADRIIDLGEVTTAQLVALYNRCDVLLFPSFYEGFGWPPLEAMACGTPVVTSTAPALVETTGDAALHEDATNHAALAAAVARVLSDAELRERLQARGLRRAGEFTWARTADRLGTLYEDVARAAARGHALERV